MKHIYFVALSIFVLSIGQGDTIDLGSLLGLGKNKTNDEDNNGPTPTKLSPVEESLKTLLIPIKAANGMDDLISKLPRQLRDPIKSTIGKGKQGFGDILSLFSDKFHAIYPGTLWCGAGDIAENEEDLGLFKRTDACCRDHDKCFSNISTDEEKDGLLNNGIFTRSHCSCDTGFYNCLKNAKSIVAAKIGFTYFTVLNPQCFAEKNFAMNHTENSSNRVTDGEGVESKEDYKEGKSLQWYDNPVF